MFIETKDRKKVYKSLLLAGVLCTEKDFKLEKHPGTNIRNLFVIKIMQSLKSKGFVSETYSWRHFYWFLTDDGINYIQNYLNLSSDILPATLKAQK